MEKRVYRPLPELSHEDIARILKTGTTEELSIVPLSVGEYCSDWKAAQDICVVLSNHADERVRANAALGLAYIARTKQKLEKHIVKPVLLQSLRNCNAYKGQVIDAIHDVNIYMKWHIGEKAGERYRNSRSATL